MCFRQGMDHPHHRPHDGRSYEETASEWQISREAQVATALKSLQRDVTGGMADALTIWPSGCRNSSVTRIRGRHVDGEACLAIIDGAARCWIANEAGLARLLANTPYLRLVDHEIAAVDHHILRDRYGPVVRSSSLLRLTRFDFRTPPNGIDSIATGHWTIESRGRISARVQRNSKDDHIHTQGGGG